MTRNLKKLNRQIRMSKQATKKDLEQQIAELTDALQRERADADNVRKQAADQQSMMGAIDNGGEDLEESVAAWMDANQDTWKAWIDAAK